ncbi:DNA binding domain-containing protein, excisionase family [Peptoniphilus asaccharolyticus DSM 20463]|uniref:DNA binding domain-containing protein, excisionase family n=1 Tax=Peptoniphilus asaccharolyticus DSM 20463 TaxID=573058 RepID=A0A1W1UZL0_PEPAS|nr:helix-turn-helix domain-containing protein [Peptoniphilus asaccharolyticus]MBL7575404.1 helix-turn-helix domain-containing protein [Peptoniphilus asaccharolyticus]SMB86535.1 DNA binding domain-containing protein, excisionase family [Peptoniphilus asaccharolyticus DSM 20463]
MKLYTVAEIAEILKVNKNAVYELINSGELPAIKGLGRIKISEDAFINYIKKIEGSNDETN